MSKKCLIKTKNFYIYFYKYDISLFITVNNERKKLIILTFLLNTELYSNRCFIEKNVKTIFADNFQR